MTVNADAQYSFSEMYLKGRGAPQAYKAADWFAKAADQGNAVARYFMGSVYSLGTVALKDRGLAYSLHTKSAGQVIVATQLC